jgi:hypothetical protein
MTAGINLNYAGFQTYTNALDSPITTIGQTHNFGQHTEAALRVGVGFVGATSLLAAHRAVLQQTWNLLMQIHGGITAVQANGITISANYALTDVTLSADLYPAETALLP